MASLEIHTFSDTLRFAQGLAAALGGSLAEIALHRFPDGESLVRVRAGAGADVVLVRSLHDPNTKLVELLLAADAARRAGAASVTLVAPYLGYLRQDKVFAPGEPVSQQVIAGLLSGAFDRVLCVEAHLHRIAALGDVFGCAAESVPAAPALARWLAGVGRPLLVGPDEESEPWLRALAERSGLPWCVAAKRRRGDREVEVSLPALSRGVSHALLVDDIVSTGATFAAAARALHSAGVSRVGAAVVHAIFAPGALEALRAAGVEEVVSSDTIPHATNRIPVAPLVAAALGGPA